MKLTHDLTAAPRDIFSESATQETELGAKIVASDGSVYRYVKAGASALVAGKLYDGPANVANHTNIAVAAAAAAGASSVTVTLGATAATANQYAGGYLVVNDEAGQGYAYRIKSNPAADASASLVLTLEADSKIIEALTTSSEVTLVPNQYNGIIIHAATETGVPVGVAVYDITAAYYGWVKTRGVASTLADASPAGVGEAVCASASTAGAVTKLAVALCPIGYALAAHVSTEYNPTFLTID